VGDRDGGPGKRRVGKREERIMPTRTAKNEKKLIHDDHNHQQLRELAAVAGVAAREQVDPLADYIREKPIKAMLMAAGAGALLGMFFLRR
jgi:ElaB/YqjD/DUF883 family membrane-anchored ribosome-binding protein